MARATPLAELEDLHRLVAKSLNARIAQDMQDDLPTDAATLGVAIKFLKDNCVTADPADSDDLSDLRDNLRKQSQERKDRAAAALKLVENDLKVMEA